MRADLKFNTSLEELNLLVESLQHYRRVMLLASRGTEWDNRRQVAAQKVLRLEAMLRHLGIEPEDVSDSTPGVIGEGEPA